MSTEQTAVTPLYEATPPAERTLPGILVRCQLAGGEDFTVRVSNRELVAWDMTRGTRQWPSASEARFLFLTFVTWKAATREGLTAFTFEQWSEAVEDLEEAEADDARPTNQGHAAS
jgi:hypothetical protein